MAAKDIGGALDLTVTSLKEGVVRLGVEAALPEISAREERFTASGDPDLEAAREIAGRTYVEDLRRISPAARATLSRELEADDLGL